MLASHPQVRATKLFGDSRAGQPLARVHPHLAAEYGDVLVARYEEAALDDVDLVLAALPLGHSQTIAATILERGVPFVDLGADFRLGSAADYERWYGHAVFQA